jgi:oligopeptide/dipeptide ABC transporter ATP-binding protein
MLKAIAVKKTFYPARSLSQELWSLVKPGSRQDGAQAVRGLDLEVQPGEILGLVGESGSGKSTLGRLLSGLYAPDQGRILYAGQDLATMSRKEKINFYRRTQFMFQDPASALNPRLTAKAALTEGLSIHGLGDRAAKAAKVEKLLTEVGLDPAMANRYPHQFSGGQRQRLSLARALSLDPEILVADEPASALDVSIQAQIVNLLLDLKATRGLTMVLVSHDLPLVALLADRVAVMYGGLIMEIIPKELLGQLNHHPYVIALWSSTLARGDYVLAGEPPDPQNPPPGCPFEPRCPEATAQCQAARPATKVEANGRSLACHNR